jgi:hypothetical protein
MCRLMINVLAKRVKANQEKGWSYPCKPYAVYRIG